MTIDLPLLIRVGGFLQWSVLIASALVPFALDWKHAFAPLPRLLRQMFWTYGAYVVIAILFNGLVCVLAPNELATTFLGQLVCGYIAVFWTVRLALQAVFDTKPFLTNRIFWFGDVFILTGLFLVLSAIFIVATFRLV